MDLSPRLRQELQLLEESEGLKFVPSVIKQYQAEIRSGMNEKQHAEKEKVKSGGKNGTRGRSVPTMAWVAKTQAREKAKEPTVRKHVPIPYKEKTVRRPMPLPEVLEDVPDGTDEEYETVEELRMLEELRKRSEAAQAKVHKQQEQPVQDMIIPTGMVTQESLEAIVALYDEHIEEMYAAFLCVREDDLRLIHTLLKEREAGPKPPMSTFEDRVVRKERQIRSLENSLVASNRRFAALSASLAESQKKARYAALNSKLADNIYKNLEVCVAKCKVSESEIRKLMEDKAELSAKIKELEYIIQHIGKAGTRKRSASPPAAQPTRHRSSSRQQKKVEIVAAPRRNR